MEITTDEGVTGLGDSQRPESPEALCYFIKDVFCPLLVGKDPSRIESLWSSMYHVLRIRGRTKGVAVEALSALDIALWDIAAKVHKFPVYDLLGGKVRESLDAYATEIMYGKSTEERLADADAYVAKGFKAFKVAAGKDVDEDISFVKLLREKFGYGVKIALDANCALSLKRALLVSHGLERYEILWLEEPLPPEFLDDYVTLRKESYLPIAAGESEFTMFGFKDWISKGALDIVQPDVGRAGGITQLKKIASMSEAFGLEFAPHCGHGSAITYSAAVQVCAAAPNFKIFELEQLDNPMRECLSTRKLDIEKNGSIRVPNLPGIGLQLDRGFVSSHKTLELSVP